MPCLAPTIFQMTVAKCSEVCVCVCVCVCVRACVRACVCVLSLKKIDILIMPLAFVRIIVGIHTVF